MLGVERYSDGGMVAGTLAWGKTCFLQLFFWGSTRNMEPWIECAVNPKNPKRSLHFFSLRHSAVPSFFPLEAESLRKLPPVNLPSWAELRLRLITNATYEPDGHNPTRVVVLYGTGWCAIEMCRDLWWFPTNYTSVDPKQFTVSKFRLKPVILISECFCSRCGHTNQHPHPTWRETTGDNGRQDHFRAQEGGHTNQHPPPTWRETTGDNGRQDHSEPKKPTTPTNTKAARSKVALRTPTVNCLGKKGVITKNGRMGILFWTFVDMILLFIQCCAKNRLISSLHWWNGFVEPERPWLVLHWGLLLSQWTQNTRTGFLVTLFLGYPGYTTRLCEKCLRALKKRNPWLIGWILRTTRSMESLQCQGHPTAAWCLIVVVGSLGRFREGLHFSLRPMGPPKEMRRWKGIKIPWLL